MNRIVINLDAHAEPIAGTVVDAAGEEIEFVGYAHLVAAIEARRSARMTPDGDRGHESEPVCPGARSGDRTNPGRAR
jgi:hypothetical protein